MIPLNLSALKTHKTPAKSITLWWLGQAGFIFKSPGGKIIVLDPYLSDSCKKIGEENRLDMNRQFPPAIPAAELAGVDAYILTHTHQDHLDPDTLAAYRGAGGRGPYFAPAETCEKLKSLGVPESEITMLWPNKEITVGDITLRATYAEPFAGDDLTHIGYLTRIKDGPKVYFTGDTGYTDLLGIAMEPHKPDVLVAVINGAFRNMGPADAARLAKQIDAKMVIPCHHDLFLDNSLPPQLLRTNLLLHGMADRYQLLEHGKAFDYTS